MVNDVNKFIMPNGDEIKIDGLYGKITNCLLEVPQRIKLELNGGTLTLKAGSQVIVPNGFEADGTTPKFDEVVVENDVTNIFNWSGSGTGSICCSNIEGSDRYILGATSERYFSGNTAPTGYTTMMWYDTANNLMKRTIDSGATWSYPISLPVGIITWTDSLSNVTSINQVFNGMGYIGSTIWVDKGVKGLIPNGRNADGSLKNIEFTTSKVATVNISGNSPVIIAVYQSGNLTTSLHYTEQKEQPTGGQTLWYKPSENILSRININGSLTKPYKAFIIATNDCTGSVISNFTPKLPFRAVDWNDFPNTPHIIDTYVNGTSGYRVWSDGYCEQWGRGGSDYNDKIVTLIKTYLDTNYNCIISVYKNACLTSYMGACIPVTTSSISISCPSAGVDLFWKTCGYLAMGEY